MLRLGQRSVLLTRLSIRRLPPAPPTIYRVRATNGTLNSAYSNEVNVTTTAVSTPVLNFPTGFAGTATQFSFNGTTPPSIVAGALQITGGVVTTAASAFALTPVNVTNFTTQFSFNQVPGTATTADGMTFTIQGVAPTAVGGTGGGLGFAGTTKSVAIKFDLFDNAGEGPNSTGLYMNGVQPNAAQLDQSDGHRHRFAQRTCVPLSRCPITEPSLQVTITDTVTLAAATQNYTVDIPDDRRRQHGLCWVHRRHGWLDGRADGSQLDVLESNAFRAGGRPRAYRLGRRKRGWVRRRSGLHYLVRQFWPYGRRR